MLIAVIGGGPIGLEFAVAACQQGYEIILLEKGQKIAQSVREWGHVTLFSPWSLNISDFGRKILSELSLPTPSAESFPTGNEFVLQYLEVLEKWLRKSGHCRILLGSEALSIGRGNLLKKDDIGGKEKRKGAPFRILVNDTVKNEESIIISDKVVDCTGVWGNANWSGFGGIPALGERALVNLGRIRQKIPNVGLEPASFIGKTSMVVGTGASAITTINSLRGLAEGNPDSNVTVIWVARGGPAPYHVVPDDPLPQRDALYQLGNRLSRGDATDASNFHLRYISNAQVCSYKKDGVRLLVTVQHDGETPGEESVAVDEVVSCVGFRPDDGLWKELQVHVCYATGGPMKLAAAIMASSGGGGGDCLKQTAADSSALTNVEPGFFVVGSKSYGRNSAFLLTLGCSQVRQVLELLAQP